MVFINLAGFTEVFNKSVLDITDISLYYFRVRNCFAEEILRRFATSKSTKFAGFILVIHSFKQAFRIKWGGGMRVKINVELMT